MGTGSTRWVFPQLYWVFPDCHKCLYNLTAMQRTGFLFLLEDTCVVMKEMKNLTIYFDCQTVRSLCLHHNYVNSLCLFCFIETWFLIASTSGNAITVTEKLQISANNSLTLFGKLHRLNNYVIFSLVLIVESLRYGLYITNNRSKTGTLSYSWDCCRAIIVNL